MQYSNLKMGQQGYTNLNSLSITTRNTRAPTLQYEGLGRNRKLYALGDVVYCDGHPVRTIGVVDYYNMQFLQVHESSEFIMDLKLMSENGIKFVRTPTGPITAGELLTTYYAGTSEKQIYLDNIRLYLNWANRLGIGVVLDLFWDYTALPTINSEDINAAYTSGSATYAAALEFITTIVTEFKDHPSLSAWEISQEYNNAWDLGSLDKSKGIAFLDWAAQQIRLIDTSDRLILTGNDGPNRVSSYEEFFQNQMWETNPESFNSFSIGNYPLSIGSRRYNDTANYLVHCRRASRHAFDTDAKSIPFILKEVGVVQGDATVLHNYNGLYSTEVLRTILDGIVESGTQLAFIWGWANKDYITTPRDSNFHPSQSLSTYKEKATLLRDAITKMRSMEYAYINPFDISIDAPKTLTQLGSVNLASANQDTVMLCVTPTDKIKHSNGKGITVDAWIYVDALPSSGNAIIIEALDYNYAQTTPWRGFTIFVTAEGRISFSVPFRRNSNTEFKTYTPPTSQCPGPIGVVKKWNHVVLQIINNSVDKSNGITFSWNGVVVYKDTKVFGNREESYTSPNETWEYEAPYASTVTIHGGIKYAVGGASIQYPKINPSKSGVANLRFYTRPIDDHEMSLAYINGTFPYRFMDAANGTVTDEWGGNITLADSKPNPERMSFTFNNTYASTLGTVGTSYTFTPASGSVASSFLPVEQRIYWDDRFNNVKGI